MGRVRKTDIAKKIKPCKVCGKKYDRNSNLFRQKRWNICSQTCLLTDKQAGINSPENIHGETALVNLFG
jgi:hypothetical protein